MDLKLDNVAEAAKVIDPVFLNSPQYGDEQLNARLGRSVLVKIETLNPLRSFKGRGADYFAAGLEPGTTMVCGTSGNFGQAVAYAARKRGLRAEVFVPADVSPVKLRRIKTLGARVRRVEGEVKVAAAAFAAEAPDRVFVVDGRDPAISEGAGTIGLELVAAGAIDTVVLPVGDGALIAGVALWLKAHTPDVRVVGVGTTSARAMATSWLAGEPVTVDRVNSFAGGISIRTPEPESVRRLRSLVDDFVLVEDDDLRAAMRLGAETLGVLPEPAGAAGLAALTVHDLPGDRVATVVTGANAVWPPAWS
ncbi:pyridoxal-phosphate dependent enzyme [Amycolatopsis roodepoortensis]|uniref:threonine ammonia-lyase n=1 Tax=Amycolatopsis roodepoortensis TaxID=700274 RepID=UPI00214CF071|nr:pyridoxal-phosphate dependent enzyme [Amycolatopsis roodepoortensis]UUV30247.1 pyridoxal-phosphate dependent enzyme [Amycolatopsis roodepoortensis]